ncbi:beta-ketoacyl-ACP synthase III [Candidatus Chloroploca asiatica]|uniref:Beta-ketoacyl-[acyl-carrier-protein] synthase III n=1 Tax=Candidatus Chloroploca asiatica TaxID=1506545 RepID=A0A2H3LDL8_9CHLR|nr:beta-ketoacyl-ACP synthase III [Candidatus Chloroploca asiatica]PDW00706.1 3-oxoacyl-ACP synthase [Candidatus Chloroploca asiatica]
MPRYAAITGWGLAVPRRVVTNAELARQMETSDEWIQSRTGIAQRYVASADEPTSMLAAAAGRHALAQAGVLPADVDTVIVATCTPDRPFPATACSVQRLLEIPRAGAFDLAAACSGFVYGLSVGSSLVQSGMSRTLLLIGADIFTHLINWQDRNTSVLFGDGAGAVVLQATEQPLGLLASNVGSWGDGETMMAVDAGGTLLPATPELLAEGRQYVYMNGREIFKHAVRGMCESSERALADAGITLDEIALVVPHQANVRIIEAVAKRLGLPMERCFVNLDRYGNTSAASVPIALSEAAQQGRIVPGDLVLLTAFGGGLTWGSAVIRWGSPTHRG